MSQPLKAKIAATLLPNAVVIKKFAMPEHQRRAEVLSHAAELAAWHTKSASPKRPLSAPAVKVVAATMVQGFSPRRAMAVDIVLALPRLLIGKASSSSRPQLQRCSAPEAARLVSQVAGVRLARPLPGIYQVLLMGLHGVGVGLTCALALSVLIGVSLALLPAKALCAALGKEVHFSRWAEKSAEATLTAGTFCSFAALNVLMVPTYMVAELETALLKAVAPKARYYQEQGDERFFATAAASPTA